MIDKFEKMIKECNVMKKALCIIFVLLCILLTAYENDSSIGIIGGADAVKSQQKAFPNLATPT